MDELLIRGALLLDGSGAEPLAGDLAVRDGRIRSIGAALPIDARRVIDADGLALMPGIIDSHTHFDAQISWDPTVRPSPALGVHGVWVNGVKVADANGMIDAAPLAGELMTEFST